jgi:hypothetical protein
MAIFNLAGAAALAAALSAQAAAQPPVPASPCERAADPERAYQIHEALGPAGATRAAAPVRLKRGAVIARETRPFAVRWMTLDDAALATANGTRPAIAFRAYRIAGAQAFCTTAVRDDLFAADTGPGRFLLRCLEDRDGDGRYESYRPNTELVAYNMRRGRIGAPSGAAPVSAPLPRPVRLVEGGQDVNAGMAPRVEAELRVVAIGPGEVTIRSSNSVAALPRALARMLRSDAGGTTFAVPLAEGTWTSPEGWTLSLARSGRNWAASAGGSWGARAAFLCGGTVVDTGSSYAVLGDGGYAIFAKPPAAAAPR